MNIAISALVLLTLWTPAAIAQGACPTRCRSCDNNVADCSMRSLTAPPKIYPVGTRTINLEKNHIRVIAERTFSNLASAEVLMLSGNKIVAIRNDAFSPLPNLMILDLANNRIPRINRRSFKDLERLQTLSLNNNTLESIEGIFQHVANLYQLNVANNKITAIGQNDLSELTRVHYLDFRDNRISNIHSEAFNNLTRLRYLFLNNNPLVTTPRFEFGSRLLQLVDFSNCALQQVPTSFPSSVTDLRLGNNKIMQVNNTAFSNITEMQLLTLNDNDLHFLEDGALSHLTRLQEIWLRHNHLVYIPRGIPNNVRKVYMDSNNIQQIETGLFSNMSHLNYLTIESNQINRIHPNTFRNLHFLNTLNFQGNQIHTLEQNTFVDIGSLSTLLLSNNPIIKIESGAFHNLGNLSQLYLSYIVEENFELEGNFLPEMLRLQTLHLSSSPGLADDLMAIIDNPANVFTPLEYMKQLDLSYNTLQWVSPRIREVFPNLASMPLDSNPLKCSHNLKWLRDWMVSSEVSFHNHEEIVCETPLRLKGKPVRSIEDNEWANNNEVSGEVVSAVSGNDRQGISGIVNEDGQALRDSEAPNVDEVITKTIIKKGKDTGKRSKDGNEKQKSKGKGNKGRKKEKKNKNGNNKKGKNKKDEKKKESTIEHVSTKQSKI